MATHLTQISDRIYDIADTAYGTVTDAGVGGITAANPYVWKGSQTVEPHILIEVPETPPVIPYSPTSSPTLVELKSRLESATRPTDIPFNLQVGVHPATGKHGSVLDIIREDLVSRVVTYRPFRNMRPNYGGRFADAMTYNDSITLRIAVESLIRAKAAEAAAYYTVDDIDIGELTTSFSLPITVYIRLPDPTAEPQPVTLTISLL